MNRTAMNPLPGVPGKDEGYWVNLGQVEKIRQHCGKPRDPLAVFYALNMCAGDHKSRSFTVTYGYIASLCGLSRRTVAIQLNELQRVGVITLEVMAV
jgi:hypothetical protein